MCRQKSFYHYWPNYLQWSCIRGWQTQTHWQTGKVPGLMAKCISSPSGSGNKVSPDCQTAMISNHHLHTFTILFSFYATTAPLLHTISLLTVDILQKYWSLFITNNHPIVKLSIIDDFVSFTKNKKISSLFQLDF